jgi:hypothetical protein
MALRGMQFLQWLQSRPEHVVAVVSHSSFLSTLFGQVGWLESDFNPKDRSDIERTGSCGGDGHSCVRVSIA